MLWKTGDVYMEESGVDVEREKKDVTAERTGEGREKYME